MKRGSPTRAAVLGWLQGTTAQGIALVSVVAALHDTAGSHVGVAAVGGVFLAVWEGARFGLIALTVALIRKRGWPLIAAMPVSLALFERFYPMFFPWSTALFFYRVPLLLQAAELGGAAAIALWVGLLAGALATAWIRRRERRSFLVQGLVSATVVALVVLYGAVRMHAEGERQREAAPLNVALVQGDIERAERATTDPLSIYRDASAKLLRGARVDLLVWPETAISQAVREDTLQGFFARNVFGGPRDRLDAPLLTGIFLEHPRAGDTEEPPSLQLGRVGHTERGRVLGSYDKRDLVILGEYLPQEARWPWLRALLPSAGKLSPGARSKPLVLDDTRILALICFEDILAERVRGDVREGDPDLIVDLTSDAWFGRSRIADLHFALATLRAIEHRRFLVHATNTGVTGVVDSTGRVVATLPPHERASGIATVRRLRGHTVYEARGPLLEGLLVIVGLALLVPLRGRRSRGDTGFPKQV